MGLTQPGSEKERFGVRVLGELALEVGGRESEGIASHRARSLLGWLAVHPGLHPRGRVAGVFWPDVLEESARSSLRTTLATLKRELGESASGVVTASRERIGIEPGREAWIDLRAFEQLVSQGKLEQAAALCRGDLLADLDDDWVNEPREHHRHQLLGVLGQLAAQAERSGDLDSALDRTREQVGLDPLSEEAQSDLVRRLAAAGDRAGALAAYQAYGVRLRRDLGMAPSAGIREVVDRVRSGEGRSFREPLGPEKVVGGFVLPTALRSVPQTPYVGRIEEHERLRASSREVRDGSRRVVLLSGEPGIGKTRLAAHAALEAHDDGFAVCWGAAAEYLSAPYGPWIQALSHYVEHGPEAVLAAHVDRHGGEIARLLRGSLDKRMAGVPMPQQADPETDQYLMFEAVVGLLQAAGEHSPVVLVLDDLHWADIQTLSLLEHVAAGTGNAPLLVLGTYRDSDLDRGHPLRGALADLQRLDGVKRQALHGLGVDEVAELVAATTGLEMNAAGLELAREIAGETDGNPFFVAEILRHLTESGALSQVPDGRWQLWSSIAELGLPHSLREVVCSRIDRLGEQLEQTLTIGAVAGRTFDVELLALLVEAGEEELLDALDMAVQASVLVESPARVGRFSFAHPVINHALYEAAGPARRSWLHRRVAEGLEQLCSEESGERLVAELIEDTVGSAGGSATVLAYQWRKAGDSERAVDYLLMAAEQAGGGSLGAEAVALYNQALELMPEGESDRRREVNLKRAVAYARYTHAIGGEGSNAFPAQRGQRSGGG